LKPILVLCLGNEVLTDDAFGFRVGEALSHCCVSDYTDVRTEAIAGFALLDALNGHRAALIIDTVVTGNCAPGTLHFIPQGLSTPGRALVSSHQISLPTALRLGELLGYTMPGTIDVLAVEAADVHTLSEEMTAPVAAAVPEATAIVEEWVRQKVDEVMHGDRDKKEAVA